MADKQLKNKVKEITGYIPSQDCLAKMHKVHNQLKAKPYNDSNVRMVAKLGYIQNLRSGLAFRNTISKQNKLTYFTLKQTKQQAESIGLAEIRSKKQYDFAHTAYLKAYQKTFDIVKAHYDTMVKTFTRDKQLNAMGIRFNINALETLYMNNLKSEISAISHLINCPLTKAQLVEVGALVSKTRYLQSKAENETAQVASFRRMSLPYFDKSKKLNERASKLHVQLKSNIKLINRLTEVPLKDIEINTVNEITKRIASLNENIEALRNDADNAKATAETYVMRSKDASDAAAADKIAQEQANKKIASIVDRARMTEKSTQQDKWAAQLAANEEAEKILRKLAVKQARKAARKGE